MTLTMTMTPHLYPALCSTMPASLKPQVEGRGIAIRAKVDSKREKDVPLSLPSPFQGKILPLSKIMRLA